MYLWADAHQGKDFEGRKTYHNRYLSHLFRSGNEDRKETRQVWHGRTEEVSITVDTRKNLLPHDIRAPFDNRPDVVRSIGLRVWAIGDGKQWFGRIISINGRHCVVQLETRWGGRSKITIDWESLKVAEDQTTPPPKRRGIDRQRVDALKEAVTKRMSKPPPPTAEEEEYQHILSIEHEELINEMERIETLLDELRLRVKIFHDRGGMPRIEIPPPKKTRKRGDSKAKLRDVRDETRVLLVSLLIEAGDIGVSSEEVVAVLCSGEITSHRVMGMLSALSRRGEATCQTGKWKKTERL